MGCVATSCVDRSGRPEGRTGAATSPVLLLPGAGVAVPVSVVAGAPAVVSEPEREAGCVGGGEPSPPVCGGMRDGAA